jgi:alkanesulfonate monooxygenase SsuD/methylene tetrahydromethanopterin reductase-like flavin-dependent oxidoreductase (luciferase family)
MTAKAAASLDVLSGGRLDLGIGAGAFWDAVEAMGGPRRTPGESVDALEEAIAVIRGFLGGDRLVTVEGEHYRVKGARPGPPPAHPIELWIGAYGPRMLGLTGSLGDGWLPSLGSHYLAPEDVPKAQSRIDEAAKRAGRDPSEVRRCVNVMEVGEDPAAAADELARVADLGFTTLIVGLPDPAQADTVRRIGEEVAPRLRSLLGETGG